MKKVITIFFILFIIGGLSFWVLADKLSGDCNRNKGSSIIIGGDKVFCDNEGRMWSHTLPKVSGWDDAVDACRSLTYAKKNDWELPDIFTLEDLYNYHYSYVVCNNREMPDVNIKNNWDFAICTPSSPAGHYYWSSSEFGAKAWRIFGYDSSPYVFEKSLKLSVRCVEKAQIIEKDINKNCNEIEDQKGKDLCYVEVAVSKQDLSICNNIQDQKLKDFCNWRIAISKQDSSICDKIQNQLLKNLKDYCYAEIAALKKDSSICDKINGEEEVMIPYHTVKDNCYQYIAIFTQDASICDKIQEQNFKDWNCYSFIKLDLLSIEQGLAICDKIQDQGSKNSCYSSIAISKQDQSICDKIQNDGEFTINGFTEKAWCYKKMDQ